MYSCIYKKVENKNLNNSRIFEARDVIKTIKCGPWANIVTISSKEIIYEN